MSDRPFSVAFQTVNADPVAAAEENYAELIEKIGNIVTENHIYFCTLGKMIASHQAIPDKSCNSDDTHFPNFIDRTIKLHLNSVEAGLDECLNAFKLNNATIIQSLIKIVKK